MPWADFFAAEEERLAAAARSVLLGVAQIKMPPPLLTFQGSPASRQARRSASPPPAGRASSRSPSPSRGSPPPPSAGISAGAPVLGAAELAGDARRPNSSGDLDSEAEARVVATPNGTALGHRAAPEPQLEMDGFLQVRCGGAE